MCDQAETLIYQAIKKQPRNFAFLLTLAKIAVHCQVSEQVKSDAINAVRNIYQISQDLYVVETLAMLEAKLRFQHCQCFYNIQVLRDLINVSHRIDGIAFNLLANLAMNSNLCQS